MDISFIEQQGEFMTLMLTEQGQVVIGAGHIKAGCIEISRQAASRYQAGRNR